MSDTDISEDAEIEENQSRVIRSRPSYSQVKAIVEFMQQHPDLAQKKYRFGMSHQKFTKLWAELSKITNSIDGAIKSTKEWIKFWSDKKRALRLKQRQIEEGKSNEKLSPIEKKILDLSADLSSSKKKKTIKSEPCNGKEDESDDEIPLKPSSVEFKQINGAEWDERHIGVMEKLMSVMDQQATAMNEMARASLNNAKALERLAEASHIQALAVDRVSSTFENVCATVHDVRNAIMSMDYTMKRYYSASSTQHRQNSIMFS